MCGIIGVFSFTENGKKTFANADSANDSLIKRGPDGGKVYQSGSVALGHRRLSIIDVSCAGDQPMTSSDGKYTIIFNGEIFNYQELRDQVLSEGERESLRSSSDTEVFLILFSRLKEKTFPLLRGFFSAAIYDHDSTALYIVRDRFGKKPLLYYKDEDKLCFASEMKALFHLGVPKKVNWSILPLYLQLSYVPQPYSMINGVQKLPPGHYLVVTGNGIQSYPYYTLQTHPEKYNALTYEKAQHQLRELMDEAVRLRLIADVPLGAFLSGGIDSSVIVALAARHTDKLKTFSVGFKDNPFFDETAYAELVAKKYKTEHTVFSLSNDDFLEHLYAVLEYIDEPFADSSALPEFILSFYTRKHVTVALSGDGGDEVFGGYNKHAAEWQMRQGGILNTAVKLGGPLWNVLPKSRHNPLTNKIRQLHRFATVANLSPADRYWQWASFTRAEQVNTLLHHKIKDQIDAFFYQSVKSQFTNFIKGEDINEVLLADMQLVLPSDMLVKVDLMSMANSLEIRSPFLDQDVVDFAFALPSAYKVDGKMKKKIVQDAFRQLLPSELYNRPKKGFEIPLMSWFKKELWGLIDNELLEEEFIKQQEIFNPDAIRQLKKQLFSSNPGDCHFTIWALIVFQYWWKHHINE